MWAWASMKPRIGSGAAEAGAACTPIDAIATTTTAKTADTARATPRGRAHGVVVVIIGAIDAAVSAAVLDVVPADMPPPVIV